jgi:hypothetical protein
MAKGFTGRNRTKEQKMMEDIYALGIVYLHNGLRSSRDDTGP